MHNACTRPVTAELVIVRITVAASAIVAGSSANRLSSVTCAQVSQAWATAPA